MTAALRPATIRGMAGYEKQPLELLERWYRTPVGSYLRQQEQRIVSQLLTVANGLRVLQLGGSDRLPLPSVQSNVQCIHALPAGGTVADLHTRFELLPFATDSIDRLVLCHVLEFADQPHQTLREAHRVLAPRGELLVLGFNPWSLFGLRAAAARCYRGVLWGRLRPLGRQRLRDWLHLLGMSTGTVRHSFCVPPWGSGTVHRSLRRIDGFATRHNWWLGGVYVLHARKNVVSITPDTLRWKQRVAKPVMGLATPRVAAAALSCNRSPS